MLYEALTNSGSGESELSEVERELSASHKPTSSGHAAETGNGNHGKRREPTPPPTSQTHPALALIKKVIAPIVLEAFTLTFLAEWGDRSQIATIGLAAASNVVGVTLGGIVGHAFCTGAAVLGGKHLAAHIDERLVSVLGGVLFLLFGAHSMWSGVPT